MESTSTPLLRFASSAKAYLRSHLSSRWSVAALVVLLGACGSNPTGHVVLDPPVRTLEPDEQLRTTSKPVHVRPPPHEITARAPAKPAPRTASPVNGRALLEQLIPAAVADRGSWANDIITAFAALEIPQTVDHFCSVIAITEQESSFRADPSVPGL